MAQVAAPHGPDVVSQVLARNRLGVPAVLGFILSAAAPLMVISGVVTTGFAVTGIVGVPLAFAVVGLVLGLFSVGYVTMARYTANAGAFYAYITRGLGRPAGVGAAWVALVAYSMLAVGLFGAIDAAVGPLLAQWFGWHLPWWLVALAAWLLVTVLGVLRVDLNGGVVAVLLVAEVLVLVVYDVAFVTHPAGSPGTVDSLDPGNLFVDGVGAVLVMALLAFTGFESAVVFSEESKNPRRTVPWATYLGLAVMAVLYSLSGWAVTVGVGPDRIVEQSRAQGPEVVFSLAATHLGATAATIGHTLFATSVLASTIAFHNMVARYFFAIGREGVLPRRFGAAWERTGSPVVGSLAQSAIGLGVIGLYALMGWDPLVQLFFWIGASGGFAILVLLAVTSLAVVVYFARHRHGEPAWRRWIAPGTAFLALTVMVGFAVANFATLLGVGPGHPMRTAIPAAILTVAVLGVAWGLILRASRPQVYAGIGLGAAAATGRLPAPPAQRHAASTDRRR